MVGHPFPDMFRRNDVNSESPRVVWDDQRAATVAIVAYGFLNGSWDPLSYAGPNRFRFKGVISACGIPIHTGQAPLAACLSLAKWL